MRILVDENIPLRTVEALRAIGHDVADIRGTAHEGMLDDPLWELAQQEERALITTDKGFARFRDYAHHGVLIVRLRQPNKEKIHERVMKAIAQFSLEEWPGLLVVMKDAVQSVSRVKAVDLADSSEEDPSKEP